jgi:hypothetical protein
MPKEEAPMAKTEIRTPAKTNAKPGSEMERFFELFFGRPMSVPMGRSLLDWDWGPLRETA